MPFEAAHRAEIYEHLRLSLKDTPFAIVGGDWNATLYPSDRQDSSRTPERDHTNFVCELGLAPPDTALSTLPKDRSRYHHPNHEGSHPSRIDDILVSKDLANSDNSLTVVTASGNSDHDLLHAHYQYCKQKKSYPHPPAFLISEKPG
jgi:exonuclease III